MTPLLADVPGYRQTPVRQKPFQLLCSIAAAERAATPAELHSARAQLLSGINQTSGFSPT